MSKLSTAQAEVIQRLQGGEVIHYLFGINARCFWHNTYKTINWTTILKLEKADLIERKEGKVVLTAQGKKKLLTN